MMRGRATVKLNRRDFLKGLGIGAAGTALTMIAGGDKGKSIAVTEVEEQMLPEYMAVLGWLDGSEYNNVILNEDAIRLTLWGLNDGALFDVPGKKRHSIGTVRVDGGTVYCYTNYDLSGKRPALEIVAHTTALKNGKTLVTSVKRCALFITDDDNGNAFYRVWRAT